jgi:SAM-dependent methyltransferase
LDFAVPPDSRWTVSGSADDLVALLRRAAEFLDSLGPVAVSGLSLDRDADDVVLTVTFDHWQLPADLDYLDPRVAAGYYGEERRDDIDFMVALAAQLDAHTIVDFGCGTGQLAMALVTRGRRVIGVDPAKAMLDLARTREGAEVVEWIWGDVRALDAQDVDLIVMTGNIPSTYVTDEAWDNVLGGLHAALRPGGHLAFLSWNPTARPWEQWGWDGVIVVPAGDGGARVGAGGGHGMELADGRERLYAPSVWRYRTQEELTRSLTRAGFVVEQTYGDWHRSPLTPASPDIVLVARRI